MKLNILPTSDHTKEYYESWKNFHKGDAGVDLVMPHDIIIAKHNTKIIDLEIKCEALQNKKPVSYYLRARSSISKTPMRVSNAVGVIDSGYRGNIKVALDNISDESYTIRKNDRLVQICAPDLSDIEVQVVDSLSETDRGEGGFGSTGK